MGRIYLNSGVCQDFVRKEKIAEKRNEINPGRAESPDALDFQKKLKRLLVMQPGNL